jgi:hypothetical protein
MQEFIQMAVNQLGIKEETARSATGGLLQVLQENVGAGDFQNLQDAIPGASDLLKSVSGGGEAGGGSLLKGVMGKALSTVGVDGGAALGIIGMLSQTGLGAKQVTEFVPMFVNFLKDKAGAGMVTQLLGKVPELKKLAGL